MKAYRLTQEQADAAQSKARKAWERPGAIVCTYHEPETPRIAPRQAAGPSKRGMNKTETRYAQDLELQKRTGTIIWYKFEGFTLTLAPGARFTPDFAVLHCSGELEFHEVKGFWREAARVRIKVAAALYPFRFIAVQAIRQKDGGGWKVESF